MPTNKYIVIFFLSIIVKSVIGINLPNDTIYQDETERFRHFTVSLDGISSVNFNGKKNMTKSNQYSLSSSLLYVTKSNIDASFSTTSILGEDKFIDEYDLGIGYTLKLFEKKLINSISFNKYFFTDSIQVKSGIQYGLNYFIKYKNDFIVPKIAFNYYKSKDVSDYNVTFYFYHDFYFEKLFSKEDMLSLTAKLVIITGTQHYYDVFIRKNIKKHGAHKNSKAGKITNNSNTSNTIDYQINVGYGINTYELVLPISYNIGRFTTNFSFAYYINVREPKRFETPNYPVYTLGLAYEF